MSYSRWGGSVWYTYWCSSDAKTRGEEVFDVCSVKYFTYDELKINGLDECINNLIKYISIRSKDPDDDMFCVDKYSKEEYNELKGYMRTFMADVEEQYNTPSQRYHDGEITLEEAVIEEL